MGVTDYKLQKKKTSKLKDIVTETILNETRKKKKKQTAIDPAFSGHSHMLSHSVVSDSLRLFGL